MIKKKSKKKFLKNLKKCYQKKHKISFIQSCDDDFALDVDPKTSHRNLDSSFMGASRDFKIKKSRYAH